MTKRIVILGSTGSIGENALRVATHLGPERVQVVGLAARTRVERMAAQAREFGCEWTHTPLPEMRSELAASLHQDCAVLENEEQLCERLAGDDVDMVLCAIVGTAGLRPVLAAIRAGKDIALASKEILVMAGALVTEEAARHGVRLLPVDSEHCAIFQCLEGECKQSVERLIITASGGPFHDCPDLDLDSVTVERALAHPTWSMGGKVTIDSATLMNKGLEVIEARWLFDMPPERIETVVHPQSIIHSMVEFTDGSVIAQMGHPDMRLPIQYCLTYPERLHSPLRRFDFSEAMRLDFKPPDHDRFPAIRLAKEALATGGVMPAVYNAANEIAVDKFISGELLFPGISRTVEATMAGIQASAADSLETILRADADARRLATSIVAAERM
ncbi:MAG: 1-deoxy-D-xylulose-5-phosphate reductoisomerase [Lentisphaeria bacterium]|nr:1-deoxy-D-xylulose-5-phosphate reductoisomerase [Lentisphaeria bacterium]